MVASYHPLVGMLCLPVRFPLEETDARGLDTQLSKPYLSPAHLSGCCVATLQILKITAEDDFRRPPVRLSEYEVMDSAMDGQD